jgi:hypothetical protein
MYIGQNEKRTTFGIEPRNPRFRDGRLNHYIMSCNGDNIRGDTQPCVKSHMDMELLL